MRRAIAAVALLGLAVSAYLTWVHYAGIEPVCTGISDCERVPDVWAVADLLEQGRN